MNEPHGSRPVVTVVRRIVAGMALIASTVVLAERPEVWSRDYTVTVVLGERTTLEEARREALRKAVVLASEEFGTAVVSTDELTDSVLQSRTRVVRAGVTKTEVRSSRVLSDDSGVARVEFVVSAEIRGDELQRQLAAMRSLDQVQQRVRTLELENQILRERQKRQVGMSSEEVRRSVLREELMRQELRRQHSEGTAMAFETGRLDQEAEQAALLDDRWRKLEEEFLEPLVRMNVEGGIATPSVEGESVQVKFWVRRNLNLGQLRYTAMQFGALISYASGESPNKGFCIDARMMGRVLDSKLQSQAVWVELEVGRSVERFMVAGPKSPYWCVMQQWPVTSASITLDRENARQAGDARIRVMRGQLDTGQMKALRRDLALQ